MTTKSTTADPLGPDSGYHETIKDAHAAGRRYHALNPETFYWAHATFFLLIIRTAEYFCGGLTAAEKCQLFDEHLPRRQRDQPGHPGRLLDPHPKPWFVATPTPVWDQLFKRLPAVLGPVSCRRPARRGARLHGTPA